MTLRSKLKLLWVGKSKDYPNAKTVKKMNQDKKYKKLTDDTRKKVEHHMMKNMIINLRNKGGL